MPIDLTIYSSNKNTIAEMIAAGAKAASDVKEIGSSCDVILTMLPNTPEVKSVMLGEGGVIETIREGATFIDMSSINPIASQEISAELAIKGVGAPLPLTAAVMEMLQTLRADGCGQDDHSAIAKYSEKLSGTKIGRDEHSGNIPKTSNLPAL